MRRAAAGALLWLLVAASNARAFAPERSAFGVRRWHPASTVLDIAQTRDGYLWFASDEGLRRGDGVRFVPLGDGVPAALARMPVRRLHATPDGALWFATGRGYLEPTPDRQSVDVKWRGGEPALYRWASGRLRRFSIEDGLPSPWVWAFAEDEDGALLVGTEAGVARLEGTRFRAWPTPGLPDAFVTALARRDGPLYVGTRGGLVRVERGMLSTTPITQVVRALAIDREGAVWAGGNDRSWRLRGDEVESVESQQVERLIVDEDGGVWAVGPSLLRIGGGDRLVFGPREGLPSTGLWSAFLDREGSLWLGSRTNGAVQLHGGDVVNLLSAGPLREEVAFAVLPARDGAVWVSHSAGLSRWRGARARHFRMHEELPSAGPRSLAEDRAGHVWLATLADGLFEIAGDRLRPRALPANGTPVALAFDARDELWVSWEQGGVTRVNTGRAAHATRHYDAGSGMCAGGTNAIVPAPDGRLLVGGFGGLSIGAPGHDGEPRWSCLSAPFAAPAPHVGGLLALDDGTILVGSLLEAGLFRVRGGDVERMPLRLDGRALRVFGIAAHGDWLWLSSDRGVFRYPRAAVLASTRAGDTPAPLVYGRAEGMASAEGIATFYPNLSVTPAGAVWVATLGGATRITEPPAPLPAPTPIIESVTLGGRPLPVGARVRLRRNEAPLEIRYTAPSFLRGDRLRFRTFIDGPHANVLPVTQERHLTLVALPAGPQRVRVEVLDDAGRTLAWGAAIDILVAPAFFETSWFFLLISVTVAALVLLFARLRVLRLQRRMRLLREERMRIARDLHDGLAQGLTSAVYMAESLSPLPAADGEAVPARLATILRHCQGALRRSIAGLRGVPEPDRGLGERLTAVRAELSIVARTALSIEGQGDLARVPRSLAREIEFLVREGVANAERHARARAVQVTVAVSNDHVAVSVLDDGQGLESAADAAGARPGFGVAGMRERVRALGGQIELSSAGGQGTMVSIRLPLPSPAALPDLPDAPP